MVDGDKTMINAKTVLTLANSLSNRGNRTNCQKNCDLV